MAALVALGCTAPAGSSPVAVTTAEAAGQAAAAEQHSSAAAKAAPPVPNPVVRDVWRSAAQASDWAEVALKIDALPQFDQAEPGTRYVRALAALRLSDCERALVALEGLAEALPLLAAEIGAMRAECQLAAGPFDATKPPGAPSQATGEPVNQVSLEGRLDAARALERAGQLERSQALVEGIVMETSDSEGGRGDRSKRDVHVRARALRAGVAERLGQLELARSDYLWLATSAETPDADERYERLSGVQLTKSERMQRAESLAKRGLVSEVDRELALLRKAPGSSPAAAELVRAQAWARYRSRADYAAAAKLYERAARLAGAAGVSDLIQAASAWSRAKESDRALAAYDQILRRHPNTRAAEQALHSKAHSFYGSGQWSRAIRAYTQYLNRYGQGKKARQARFVLPSRYERAVAQLAAGDAEAARAGFEQLGQSRQSGYEESMLEHLEAVALAGSGSARKRAQAVARFEQVVRRYPLSFAALSSAARLVQLGHEAPRLEPPPVVRAELSNWPELPAKARLLADLGLNSAAEGTLHDEEPMLRALYSSRAGETLCRQYESLDRGWRRYSLAAGMLTEGMLHRAPTELNLWAWQCLYPRPYASTVERLEQRYGLPAGLIYSVMRQESEFRPDARSSVGAVGLMQLMPTTAERAARELALEHQSERLTQAEYNLELGAFYLSKLLGGLDQRVVLAVASYNAGPHAVSRWLEGSKGLPLDIWAARIPFAETRNYVVRVMSNWARYRYLGGGPDNVPRLALGLPARLELASDAY